MYHMQHARNDTFLSNDQSFIYDCENVCAHAERMGKIQFKVNYSKSGTIITMGHFLTAIATQIELQK